ncbi:hypothetical protein BDB00DRAFT_874840 [Zychaea mexicana]|uniref:uncharacterized protein n=1 Tax=Zychaea mexicana TaxID=64656 RepID=UPI0022FF2393|nr:uncharacterized protein BDB00DRAFT_874840 [Zychaea mexicana]KAI9490997.1 hypothetical protein BDB00DRAFT_874840 [Zychaea mexicana]
MSCGREKISTKKRARSKRKTVDKYVNDGRAPDTAQMLKKANRKNRKYIVEVSDCDTGGDNSSSSEDVRVESDCEGQKTNSGQENDDSGSSEVPSYTKSGSVNRAVDLLSLSSDEEMDDGSFLPSQ